MFYLFNNNNKYTELDISADELKGQECIVCYDHHAVNKKLHKLKFLLKKSNLYSDCSCNSLIHHYCFNTWCSESFTCPICRKELIVDVNTGKYYIVIIIAIVVLIIIIILDKN